MDATIQFRDLDLAAALVSYGLKLVQTGRDEHGRFYKFKETELTIRAIDAYWRDALTVPASTFANNQKRLAGSDYELLEPIGKSS